MSTLQSGLAKNKMSLFGLWRSGRRSLRGGLALFSLLCAVTVALALGVIPARGQSIPSPWSDNDNPFVIDGDYVQMEGNDVVGEDSESTILRITGDGFTFTNNATISDMWSLDTTGVQELINNGTIENLSGQIIASNLTNSDLIQIIGSENSGLDNALDVNGTLNNSGYISTMLGNIDIGGNFNNEENGVLESVEGNITIHGDLTNQGEITNSIESSGFVLSAQKIDNTSLIHQISDIVVTDTLHNSQAGELKNITTITTGTLENYGRIESVEQITGNVTNNGTILLGTGQNTMTFAGNLTNATGTLVVGIGTSSEPQGGIVSDLYQVVDGNDGTNNIATIDGGHVLVKVRNGLELDTFQRGKENALTFLTSESGLTVTGSGLAVDPDSDQFKLFGWALGHDSHSYLLWLDRRYKYGDGASTYNESQFGNYLDKTGLEVVLGSDYENVLEALDSLNSVPGQVSAAARQAMSQMSGAIYGSLRTMSVWNQSLVNQQFGNMLRPMCERCPCCEAEPGTLNFWGKYFGATGGVETDGNASGFDYSLSGMMSGIDMNLGANTRLGGYFSYIGAEMTTNGLNEHADITSYLGGLYLVNTDECGYWLANANFGYDEYDVHRRIMIGHGTTTINRVHNGTTGGNQSGVRFERGFNFMTGHAMYQPFVSLQYIHIDSEAIHEDGPGATSLMVEGGNYNSFRSELGARILFNNNLVSNEHVDSRFMLQASWIHEYGHSYDSIRATTDNAQLANYTTTAHYMARGVDLGGNWCNLGVGFDWACSTLTFHGGYDFLFNGRQNLSTGNAGLALDW